VRVYATVTKPNDAQSVHLGIRKVQSTPDVDY
jgi:hypothetical protein